jgi:signal peptide peptidase SppA
MESHRVNMLKPNIASLLLNQPLLVTPEHAETLLAILGNDIGVNAAEMAIGGGGARPAEMNMGGGATMIIPIVGSLTHRTMGLSAQSGLPSYSALQAQIEEGMSNSDVSAILLDFSSPGGLVSGAFDLRDYVMSQRGRKPIMSIARDQMASAAYLIGSATDRVITTQTAGVGSIGVVMAHMDKSEQLQKEGIKPTFIYAGAHKIDGNSAGPLSDDVRAGLQEEINESYEMFVNAVAESRGMSADSVRSTEARMYSGAAAVKAGLADQVGTLSSTLESFAASAPRSYPSMSIQGENGMTEEEMRAEERARISAIVGGDAANGREALAHHFAFNTNMSADDALAAMSVAPIAAPAEPSSVEPSAELAAALAENAALKAAAGSDQAKALAALAADGAGVAGDAAEPNQTSPEAALQARATEAAANARAFFRK